MDGSVKKKKLETHIHTHTHTKEKRFKKVKYYKNNFKRQNNYEHVMTSKNIHRTITFQQSLLTYNYNPIFAPLF